MHGPHRDHTDLGASASNGKRNVEQMAIEAFAHRVKTRIRTTVLDVLQKQQGLMQKHLLRFLLRDTMLIALALVSGVPFEFLDPGQVQHSRISL